MQNEKSLIPSPQPPAPSPHIHLIAIAGVGMAALAAMLKERGYQVTGSDQGVYTWGGAGFPSAKETITAPLFLTKAPSSSIIHHRRSCSPPGSSTTHTSIEPGSRSKRPSLGSCPSCRGAHRLCSAAIFPPHS